MASRGPERTSGSTVAEPGVDSEGSYSARFDNLRPGLQVNRNNDRPLIVNPQVDPHLNAAALRSLRKPELVTRLYERRGRGL